MADDDVSTERIKAAATGEDNIPVTPEQFDRWMYRLKQQIEDAAWSLWTLD